MKLRTSQQLSFCADQWGRITAVIHFEIHFKTTFHVLLICIHISRVYCSKKHTSKYRVYDLLRPLQNHNFENDDRLNSNKNAVQNAIKHLKKWDLFLEKINMSCLLLRWHLQYSTQRKTLSKVCITKINVFTYNRKIDYWLLKS